MHDDDFAPTQAPDPAEDDAPAGLAASLHGQLDLAAAAARVLGASTEEVEEVRCCGLLQHQGRDLLITPLGPADDADGPATACFLVTLYTGRFRRPEGADEFVDVLAHAPSALLAFGASIGLCRSGEWVIHRRLATPADEPRRLAEALAATLHLSETLLTQVTPPPRVH